MSTRKLSNISIAEFQAFLEKCHCKYYRTKGGHETWGRKDLLRPITIQTHISPVPERIVRQILGLLGLRRADYFDIMDNKCEVVLKDNEYVVEECKI